MQDGVEHYSADAQYFRHNGSLVLGPDGLDGELGEYEMAQRRAAAKGIYRYFLAEGPNPFKILKRVYALGRGLMIEEFANATMTETAILLGETKGSQSWRFRNLSELMEKLGMKGTTLPGQKSKSSKPNYAAAQAGNRNRVKAARSSGA